jgi:hypothetical protein
VENFTVWGHVRKTLHDISEDLTDLANTGQYDTEGLNSIVSQIEVLLEELYSPHVAPRNYREEMNTLQSTIPTTNKLFAEFKDIFSDIDYENDSEPDKEYFSIYCIAISFGVLNIFVEDDKFTYQYFISQELGNELKNNFQIDNIDELITKGSDELVFEFEDIIVIKKTRDEPKIYVELHTDAIDFFRQKPNSVFFESPAYWRVRDALIEAKLNTRDDYLTGVPKYFFDLDRSLRLKSKSEEGFESIFEKIRDSIGGEFEVTSKDIVFKDNQSDEKISKNIVSFGMTNLGMLNSLIKNNVIRCGSFVFIDEPETNLHPDWQVLMIDSLIALSKKGVKVIVNTHSIEILKKLENVYSSNNDSDNELAVNYMDTDGESLEFETSTSSQQIKECRELLASTYFDLYMNGAIANLGA